MKKNQIDKIQFNIEQAKAGRKVITRAEEDVIIIQYDSTINPGFPIIAASTVEHTEGFSHIDFYKPDGKLTSGFDFSSDLFLYNERALKSFDNIIARDPSRPWELNIFSCLMPKDNKEPEKGTIYDIPVYAMGMIDNRSYKEYHLFKPWMEKYIGTKIPFNQWKLYGDNL